MGVDETYALASLTKLAKESSQVYILHINNTIIIIYNNCHTKWQYTQLMNPIQTSFGNLGMDSPNLVFFWNENLLDDTDGTENFVHDTNALVRSAGDGQSHPSKQMTHQT